MGQQQFLLIALAVIVIGIAVAVGITLFRSNAQSSNRDQIVSDIQRLGSLAQAYYKKPSSMAGGNGDFKGFSITVQDAENYDGGFSLSTSAPGGTDRVRPSITPIGTSAQTIYIIGYGVEVGTNNRQNVKAYARVTPDQVQITILN